ncbi:MAG TPA: response regulator [Usitatibacter sp.]|nr:response regulator [Usitatibacter sp.]
MKATVRVLVVDDDPVVGRSFDRVLAEKGYAVISAPDGESALERLAQEDYDVVYTDLKMPGMSGIEVARRIKSSRPGMPVVVITGFGTPENEREAHELGTTAFLHKPLSPEAIEDSIDMALNAIAAARASSAATRALETAVDTEEPAAMTVGRFAKNVGLFVAAPFIGFVYILAFPFVGLGMVAWIGIRSLAGGKETNER